MDRTNSKKAESGSPRRLTTSLPGRRRGKPAGGNDVGDRDIAARIQQQLADLDARLSEAVGEIQEQLRSTSAVLIHQADAAARIVEAAESRVAWLTRLGQATEDEGDAGPLPTTEAGRPDPVADLTKRVSALAARCEHLEAARAVAEAGHRAKSCFLAAVSRELRTPVDGINRMIELLRDTRLDEEQKRLLRTAACSASALSSLADSIFRIADLDIAELNLRSTDFDLRTAIGWAVERLDPIARAKGVRLGRELDPDVPTLVRGDPGRLRQIMLYTIRHSLAHAADGDLQILVAVSRSTERTVTLHFRVQHDPENGPARATAEAFTPPSRLDADSIGPGRRVGLAIALRFVELMGGEIGADRNAQQVWTIWFTIPLDRHRRASDDRRAHGRLPQELLQSSLGPVLDLSMGGMRVRSARVPKSDELQVELLDVEEPLTLPARVMWTRRLGFRKHEIGLRFRNIRPQLARQLTRISLNHRLRRLLGR